MIDSILVPIDGSAHSKKALEYASKIASRFSADISLVNVREGVATEQTMVMGSSHVTVPLDIEEARSAGKAITDAATELIKKNGLEVARADILVGSAANRILETAALHDVDTIIMGSRGLSDLKGLLMGSVSHKVGHLATCTCIIVR